MKCFLFLVLAFSTALAQTIPPNVQVNTFGTFHPEVTIAINPADPQNLLVSSNGLQVYYSYDGGQTWGQHYQSSVYGNSGDPSVIFDYHGNAYLATLAYQADSNFVLDRIIVHRSEDGGNVWNYVYFAGFDSTTFQDKEWLAADHTSSSFKGNLYLSWTRFDACPGLTPLTSRDSTRIMFAYSTDSATSWSSAIRISDRQGDCSDKDSTTEGAVPAVGPQGQVYIAWAGLNKIWFDKSTDGGRTFGNDKIIAEQPGGWDFPVSGLMRCNGLPQTLCDTSKSSPFYGTIYVVFSDQRNGEDNTDVFLVKSTDQGETWSAPVKVNQDTGRAQQFFPWAAIDPGSGYLYVVFYDRREHKGDTTDVYLARSTDGGETFSDFRVNQDSFVPCADYFLGDYIGITALNGNVYPVWVKMVSFKTSIYLALVSEPVGVEQSEAGVPVTPRLMQNFPNPFNPVTHIVFDLPQRSHVRVEVFDLNGRKVATLVHGWLNAGRHQTVFDATGCASGVYLYQLSTDKGFVQSKKMLLLR